MTPVPEKPQPWFVFHRDDIVLRHTDPPELPTPEDREALTPLLRNECPAGAFPGEDLSWGDLDPRSSLPPGFATFSRRSLWDLYGEDLFVRAGRAFHLAYWERTHAFCGCCGAPTQRHPDEVALRCPRCEHVTYPVISPAVIMAIRRDDKILLARGAHFVSGTYSVLAGFVTPGETLEQAVAREVKEETGIDIDEITYFASQPWPFPQSLMVAFKARWAGGEIAVDRRELEDARWFSPGEDLPIMPSSRSVSRRLIDDWRRSTGATLD
ncbi:MAG: NADH pyrophosphatase [Synergistetes bacterium ADurb.Bin520]|nr:MAG: NADH pyrophosphatase [Synergistetes bacterium ADurb.Bin520]